MASVDLDAGLGMTVARECVRPWIDKALTELHLEVALRCPPARIWQSMSDDKVRPAHRKADGQAIPANLRFILDKPERGPTVHGQVSRGIHHAEGHHGGRTGNIAAKPEQYGTEQGRYPRDEALSAGNRIHCRCQAVTVAGMIAATVIADPVEVAGAIVRGTVGSRFPRIAESEFGDGEDAGLHFMSAALGEYSGRLDAAAAR